MSQVSNKVFNKINRAVESSLKDILKDISKRYEIEYSELENEFFENKKKKNEYTIYSSKRRKELKKENPDMDFGEMSRIIGQEWRELNKQINDEKKSI